MSGNLPPSPESLIAWFAKLGWTYTGVTTDGVPLFTAKVGTPFIPDEHVVRNATISIATCDSCGHPVQRSSRGLPWTTYPGDGYTSWCEVGKEFGHVVR